MESGSAPWCQALQLCLLVHALLVHGHLPITLLSSALHELILILQGVCRGRCCSY
jgi:hypothetical protein